MWSRQIYYEPFLSAVLFVNNTYRADTVLVKGGLVKGSNDVTVAQLISYDAINCFLILRS